MVNSNLYFGEVPSLGGNVALLAVIGAFLLYHFITGLYYQQYWITFCWSIGMLLEIAGYAGRVASASAEDLTSVLPAAYRVQFVCLMVAPIFLMAGIYYILAQCSVVMGDRYLIIKPSLFTPFFFLFDLAALVLQVVGVAFVSHENEEVQSMNKGAHILIAGLACQVFTMVVFNLIWYIFWIRTFLHKSTNQEKRLSPQFESIRSSRFMFPFVIFVSCSLLFLLTRTVYRLAESVEGYNYELTIDEIYLYVLDGLMICLSLLFLSLHPGFIYGKNPGFEQALQKKFKLFKFGNKHDSIDPEAEQKNIKEMMAFRLSVDSLGDRTMNNLEDSFQRMGTVRYQRHGIHRSEISFQL